jgi:type IV pilus assembly protein PilW
MKIVDQRFAPRARRLMHTVTAAGFSLVELMIAMVIGLLAILFVTRMSINSEMARQSSLGGSDSMQNGMAALFSVSRDAGQAGWGLNDVLINGCDTVFHDNGSTSEAGTGYVLASATRGTTAITPLSAAVIVANANGTSSDEVTLYSGSSLSGTGSLRLVDDYVQGATSVSVDRAPYGFALNDVIVVVPETAGSAKCSLAQISTDPSTQAAPPSTQKLQFATGTSMRFNTGDLKVTYKNGAARLFNLGPASALSFHTWSVSNGFLQLRATDMIGASKTAATVSDNIVALKAEYGFDTRTGSAFDPTAGMQVSIWSPTMINADGGADGVAGDAGDFQRIAALRIGVVARSKNPEKPNADGTCTTTVASALATSPTVLFADAVPSGVAAAPVTVSLAVANDPVSWQCYRYRKFETIVPIRNSGWRPS